MLAYLGKRVGAMLPTILVPVLLVFLLTRLAPGDPARVMLGDSATEAQVAQVRHELGLDQPLGGQFLHLLHQLVTLDLGNSIFLNEPVIQVIASYGAVTLELAALSLVICLALGVLAGVFAALRQGKLADRGIVATSAVGISMPEFWLGLLLALVFAVHLRLFPVSGYVPMSEGPALHFGSLMLPALSLGLVQAAFVARVTRSAMLDVLHEPFVTTARSQGVREFRVVRGYVLRLAAMPVMTVVGLIAGLVLGGAVTVETVFGLPGMGRLLVEAVSRRDYPLIQGIVLITGLALIVVNLLVDLLYLLVDPRVQYSEVSQ